MQIYYKPNLERGNITIELSDMIFMDKDMQLVRPTLIKRIPDELRDRSRARNDLMIPSKYKATFPPIENGVIDFMQNRKNGLDLVIKNMGYDTIVLNNRMFDYIYHNLFTNIRIFDSNELKIMDLTLKEIQEKLLNKTIDSGYYLHFQILPSFLLEKNKYYYITFKNLEINDYKELPSEDYMHLISWMFGKDKYRYDYDYFKGSSRFLYKFIISENGTFNFSTTLE